MPIKIDKNQQDKKFLKAAKLKCMSQIEEASAKINLYANNAVGVGDHPNIMEEILKAAEQGAHAQDILDFLEKCPR